MRKCYPSSKTIPGGTRAIERAWTRTMSHASHERAFVTSLDGERGFATGARDSEFARRDRQTPRVLVAREKEDSYSTLAHMHSHGLRLGPSNFYAYENLY